MPNAPWLGLSLVRSTQRDCPRRTNIDVPPVALLAPNRAYPIPVACRLTVSMEFPRTTTPVAAWVFALSARADGSPEGIAVVSPEARYCSVQWAGAPRITRRHVTPAQWREVTAIGNALVPGALDGGNTLATLITGERGRAIVVTFTGVQTIETLPERLAETLDTLLTVASP
jgi:hypothetical protein